MNIYMVSRWGNEVMGELEDGPDGADTNFLVRASSPEKAAALANERLRRFPNEGLRDYCESISLLGTDNRHADELVIHGPFVSHAYFSQPSHYQTWVLDPRGSEQWQEQQLEP